MALMFSATAKDGTDAVQPPTAVASAPTGATFDTNNSLLRHAIKKSGGGTDPTSGRSDARSDTV